MSAFAVCIVSDGMGHQEALRELAVSLCGALRELGHAANVIILEGRNSQVPTEEQCIVLGSHNAPRMGLRFPPDAILYNTEQVGSPWFTPELIALYDQHTVWDYSASNAARFHEHGLRKPAVVSFGYHEAIEKFAPNPEEERDIDVIHVGSLNPRRAKILEALRAEGLKVLHVFGVYGTERDKLLARAKVALNVHFYESKIFESVRVGYYAANGVVTVSEQSDRGEGKDISEAVPYDEIVARCHQLVFAPLARQMLSRTFQERMRSKRMAHGVYAALGGRTARPHKLVLNMIVKNETRVLKRCLESVKPWVDAWVIVDTGSTDGTQALVREVMAGIPGELIEQPWVREDKNRTQAFEAARQWGTHVFWIDADEELIVQSPLPVLTEDAYVVTLRYERLAYARCAVLSTHIAWRWEGPVHPGLFGEGSKSPVQLEAFQVIARPEGSTRDDPRKYGKHVELLREAVQEYPNNPRYQYYLAQSYLNAGLPHTAREEFLKRAAMRHGWDQETWSAKLEAAKLSERVLSFEGVVDEYVQAFIFRRTRTEPLYWLARYCRIKRQYVAAAFWAALAHSINEADGVSKEQLFVEHDVYTWRTLDELALSLHGAGNVEGARDAMRELVKRDIPPGEVERVRENYLEIVGEPWLIS